MYRKTSIIGFIFLSIILCISISSAGECLRIDQEVKGIPGLKEGEKLRQRLYIMGDKLRLDESAPGSEKYFCRCLLLSTRNTFFVYEFLHKTKTYRVWDELRNIQEDRDLFERQMIGVLPADKLAANHLRPNLERIVEMKTEPGKTIEVGEESYKCKHIVVKENGLDVVDAQVTDEVSYVINYYMFYRKIGVFSDEVLAKLKTLKGFPLLATIRVVTRKPKWHTLSIEVKDLVMVKKGSDFFELPKGWTKDEKPLVTECFYRNCRNKVETANPGGGKFRYQGRWVYFCSKKCRLAFKKEYMKRLRKKKYSTRKPGEIKSKKS